MVEKEAIKLIENSSRVVFLTGAGVSTASGIPDYRSMTGVYQGIEEPEYLLSHTCLMGEPDKFYRFVQQLYHETAEPNIIHKKMKELENKHDIRIISQNIDGLHDKAKSQHVVNFHGSLYDCYCLKCQKTVSTKKYLQSATHEDCGGLVRPNVVLYEEGLSSKAIETAIKWIQQADLIVIVGTSFKVYPFSGLIDYRDNNSQVIVVNNEAITLHHPHLLIQESAEKFFSQL